MSDPERAGVSGREWWKEAVVYQIYPRSFNDSDGDGVGDIPGIIEKLDYLDSLGVDCVWLNPVYESPNADAGYDISDYRAIMDEFGTMADWDRLLEGLHDRGIRLIMDLVVNHTSDEHEWFLQSRESKKSDYRDYYIWREGRNRPADAADPGPDGRTDSDSTPGPDPVADVLDGGPEGEAPPNNWESFFGGPAWTYDDHTGEWYLHLFDRKQPDLNWANPAMREDLFELTRFWLEKGIDGFRLDAVDLLSKAEGLPDGSTETDSIVGAEHAYGGPHLRASLREFRREAFADTGAFAVGEAMGTSLAEARELVAEDGSLDAVFHEDHMGIDVGDDQFSTVDWKLTDLKTAIARWQEGMYPDGWNAPYLGNHDQPRAVSRFGDPDFRYESATMLGTLLLTLRGTPFIYQGDEIGTTNYPFSSLSEVRDVAARNYAESALADGASFEAVAAALRRRSRDNGRTPMQWSGDEHAGFTDGEPWIPVNPNHDEVNVAAEKAAANSVLAYYRDLIDLRHDTDVLVYGRFDLLDPDHESVFAYTRTLETDGSDPAPTHPRALVVLHADGGRSRFEPPAHLASIPADVAASNYDAEADRLDPVELRPYEARVYLIEASG